VGGTALLAALMSRASTKDTENESAMLVSLVGTGPMLNE
jgi:hypothetical protein